MRVWWATGEALMRHRRRAGCRSRSCLEAWISLRLFGWAVDDDPDDGTRLRLVDDVVLPRLDRGRSRAVA